MNETKANGSMPSDNAVAPPLVAPANYSRESESRRRRSTPQSNDAAPSPFPRSLATIGLSVLAVLTLSGLMLGQKPPPIEEPNATVTPPALRVISTSTKRPIEVPLTDAKPGIELPRPSHLFGAWDLQESGGGTIEFSADGAVVVDAPLLSEKPLAFSTRWFVVVAESDNYDLELGPEALQASNHKLRIVRLSDDKLKLIRYSNTTGMNVRERTFLKRK